MRGASYRRSAGERTRGPTLLKACRQLVISSRRIVLPVPRRISRLALLAAFSAGILLAGFPEDDVFARAQSPESAEYEVKAAFLYNFAKFVEWPADAFQNEKAPIALCVFLHDPFGNALDDVIRGKTINKRELAARRVSDPRELRACQLVFVSDKESKHLPEMLNALKGASALVVGETDQFAEGGGGIQFYMEDNKVRFSANVDALQRARLTVSSKLLALARIVHEKTHRKED